MHERGALFHHPQRFGVRFSDGGLGPLRRLQRSADAGGGGPVDQGQVKLVAHHRPLVQVRLVGSGQVFGKPVFSWVGQRILNLAVQPVGPDGPLATREIAQQATKRFVPFRNQVVVGALECHAVEAPHPQEIATTGDHIVVAHQ
ncbi:hypothetical protein [Acidovorax temperans]|uniref:hypothetical protein n=1 Tax=Acidovorax temperans TaxID=80878 RepID=UPI003204D978